MELNKKEKDEEEDAAHVCQRVTTCRVITLELPSLDPFPPDPSPPRKSTLGSCIPKQSSSELSPPEQSLKPSPPRKSTTEPSTLEPYSQKPSLPEPSLPETFPPEHTSVKEPSPSEPSSTQTSSPEPSTAELSLQEQSPPRNSTPGPSIPEMSPPEQSPQESSLPVTSLQQPSLLQPSLLEPSLQESSPPEQSLLETSPPEPFLQEPSELLTPISWTPVLTEPRIPTARKSTSKSWKTLTEPRIPTARKSTSKSWKTLTEPRIPTARKSTSKSCNTLTEPRIPKARKSTSKLRTGESLTPELTAAEPTVLLTPESLTPGFTAPESFTPQKSTPEPLMADRPEPLTPGLTTTRVYNTRKRKSASGVPTPIQSTLEPSTLKPSMPQKCTPGQSMPESLSPEPSALRKSTSQKSTSEPLTPGLTTPRKRKSVSTNIPSTQESSTPQKCASGQSTSKLYTAELWSPELFTPGLTVPDQSTPRKSTPQQKCTGLSTPDPLTGASTSIPSSSGQPTPEYATPQISSPESSTSHRPSVGARRRFQLYDALADDSGSEDGEGQELSNDREKDDEEAPVRFERTEYDLLQITRQIRNQIIEQKEVESNAEQQGGNETKGDNFSWSDDFSSFSGQKEQYLRSPGPNCNQSDPTKLFMLIWDLPIVTYLVEQYNKYATDYIFARSESVNGLNQHLMTWQETTVDEMYRFLAVLNFMALGKFERMDEYWKTGVMGMPGFRKIIPRNRFQFLLRFMHFIDNDYLLPFDRSYDRKIAKISPLVEHCNSKFSSLYTPRRHLSLDESLLLWKGKLSFKQCIRTKAARVGVKSFDLCEARTGYLLRCVLYAGKDSSFTEGSSHSSWNCTAKVVLKLMNGYLDVGHCLVMDNWYNQLSLTRYLKKRRTDVIGTLDRRRRDVPPMLRNVNENSVPRGEQMSLHCGDISIVTWKDLRLVTIISTYHNADQVTVKRRVQDINKPKMVAAYNKYMGGVDLKDQKLSSFHFERKRGLKWYMKVFRRLLNTSLLNAYIIYQHHPRNRVLTHRDFRMSVAEGLLAKFPPAQVPRPVLKLSVPETLRFDGLHHYPDRTAEASEGRLKHTRRRCVHCSAKGRRTEVNTICCKCDVALCLGLCYQEYHTPPNTAV